MATFDAAKATAQYIDGLGAEALEKSAAYTVGGHWITLWGLIISAVITWLIIKSGILDKVSKKMSGKKAVFSTFCVIAMFVLVSAILSMPFDIYTDWVREGSYGLTSQPLSDYLMQSGQALIIGVMFIGLFFTGVYALIKRTKAKWWLWSGGLAALTITLVQLLAPILIMPLFNEFKPLPEGEVRDAMVAMAKEANIAEDRIFVYDGSRQSNNFTANVAGIGSSARIAISDVALKSASLDEVKAVTGHEIGHYVLGHTWRSVIVIPLLVMFMFFLADRLFPFFGRLFGSNATIDDPRGIPILMFIIGLLSLLSSPVGNGLTRVGEREADQYSLETVNLPDALASALVKTAEYRYPRPHPVQEFLFYTHPSVEWRVRNAMDWKAKTPPNK